ILYVLQGPLRESASCHFLDWIVVRNPAAFIQPSSRTPSAALNSMFEGDVERHAIDPRLPNRNNFHLPRRVQSPVGTMSARSTIKITVRSGARVRWRTPFGTT